MTEQVGEGGLDVEGVRGEWNTCGSAVAGMSGGAAMANRPPFPTAPGDGVAEFSFVRGKTALRSLR